MPPRVLFFWGKTSLFPNSDHTVPQKCSAPANYVSKSGTPGIVPLGKRYFYFFGDIAHNFRALALPFFKKRHEMLAQVSPVIRCGRGPKLAQNCILTSLRDLGKSPHWVGGIKRSFTARNLSSSARNASRR